MKKISELTRDTQILCDSDEQRTAVFGLCEQVGKRMYLPETQRIFDEAPNVLVYLDCWYHETIAGIDPNRFHPLPASDFLPLSHVTTNPNDPQPHSANC